MSGPTHRHRPTGSLVFPAGYPAAELELLAPAEVAQLADEERLAAQWQYARAERDARIAATDWTQGGDAPVDLQLRWRPYRQALRDLTDQPDPAAIAWPEPPAEQD